MALIATPFMLGHIFMATINPSTRKGLPGMFLGWVDREWARHHYTAWYREWFGDDEKFDDTGEPRLIEVARATCDATTEEMPDDVRAVEVET